MESNFDNSIILNYIITNVRSTHYQVALLLKELYHNRYRTYIYDNQSLWYNFNGAYWQLNPKVPHQINMALSNEIASLIIESRTLLSNRLQNPPNTERIFEETRLKELETLTDYLYDNTFKKGVISECESLFLQDINNSATPTN